MRSTAPSHKGAENLRMDLTKRLIKLKEKQAKERARKGGSKTMTVKKEGASQVVLVGKPNSGKSTLLKAITNANPVIAPYEFTTTEPEVGVMDYRGAKIQVVEVPALIEGSYEGKARGREKLAIIRNGDCIIISLLGGFIEIKKQIDVMLNEFDKSGIKTNLSKPLIEIKKTGAKGLDIIGKQYLKADEAAVISLLMGYNLHSVTLVLQENADLKKIEQALDNSLSYKRVIGLWLNGEENFEYKNVPVFAVDPKESTKLKDLIYEKLNLILVYTKKPREKDEDKLPIVLPKGATIDTLCDLLHKDFKEKFNYAKVWGSARFPGQTVSKDFVLKDKDVIEIILKR